MIWTDARPSLGSGGVWGGGQRMENVRRATRGRAAGNSGREGAVGDPQLYIVGCIATSSLNEISSPLHRQNQPHDLELRRISATAYTDHTRTPYFSAEKYQHMLALLPLSSGLVVNQASLLRAGSFDARPRAPIMGAPDGATRDPEPGKQSFDNDMSGWKPPGGGGGGHAMGGDASKFEGTDTPDFMPDEGSELAGLAAGISYTDGMQGSRECAEHVHTKVRRPIGIGIAAPPKTSLRHVVRQSPQQRCPHTTAAHTSCSAQPCQPSDVPVQCYLLPSQRLTRIARRARAPSWLALSTPIRTSTCLRSQRFRWTRATSCCRSPPGAWRRWRSPQPMRCAASFGRAARPAAVSARRPWLSSTHPSHSSHPSLPHLVSDSGLRDGVRVH